LNKQLTHAELQALIENTGNGLKRYLDNTVYWNVKVTGEDITAASNGSFTLAGYKCFTDVRGTESITYDVSIITYLDDTKKVWLSNDLRAEYGTDGVKLPSLEEQTSINAAAAPVHVVAHTPVHQGSWNVTTQDGAAGELPEQVRNLAGLYYYLQHETYGDKMIPTGWTLPTIDDFKALINAVRASGANNTNEILATSTNEWNMNLINNCEWTNNFTRLSFAANTFIYAIKENTSRNFATWGGLVVGNIYNNNNVALVRIIYDGE
jgi:uncharacterized protein (TIGR02145 family)